MASVLILTQYYPPETGAPQNRLSSLAKYLKKLGMDVTVLTAMPNYPKMEVYDGYKKKWRIKEERDGITVHRSWIYTKKSKSIIWRLANYFSFVFSSLVVGIFNVKKHDIIICESPPLFLGITALMLKVISGSKLVFNVSDLWPESAEKLGIITNKRLLGMSQWLEEYIYKKSSLISGQTQGIVNNIRARFPDKKLFWLRNGIDLSQFNANAVSYNWREKNGFVSTDFIAVYGGIIGYAQNLEVILQAANILKEEKNIKFVIVGDGPEKAKLLELKEQLGLQNVYFFPNQPSAEMPNIIDACNATIVPLRNIELFKGAIPSKIFEYLIFRKPLLLGVDGEARSLFIDEGNCGLFFTPENEKELASGLLELKNEPELSARLGENGEAYVRAKFNREKIAEEFYNELLTIVK